MRTSSSTSPARASEKTSGRRRKPRKSRAGWARTTDSFWFLPAAGIGSGVLLSSATHRLDKEIQDRWAEVPLVFSGGAADAHYMLSVITGSLITVIATAFSLTIVILQLASGQYSPRLLRSFKADRGVQTALGAYIATFVYALMTLEKVYKPSREDATVFIPVLSVSVTIFLALVCVALLTYFMQHISKLIQSSTIVVMVQRDTMKVMAGFEGFEAGSGDAPEKPGTPPEGLPDGLPDGEPLVVRSVKTGYLQCLDEDRVVEALEAVAADSGPAVVEIPFAPGHFVGAGTPLVKVWPNPASGADLRAHRKVHRRVLRAFEFDQERSFRQDFAFGLRQLSDIALRGLSPGVNDPTTAMQTLDRLECIFVSLGSKNLPPRERESRVNGFRALVRVRHPTFEDNVGLAFDQVRRAALASGDVAVLERFLEVIGRTLEANARSEERQRALWRRALAVARQAPRQIPDPRDAADLVRRAINAADFLTEPGRRAAAGELRELERLYEQTVQQTTQTEEVEVVA